MPNIGSIRDLFLRDFRKNGSSDENGKTPFREYYKSFREILKNNNTALLTMGDMQEKADGAYLFDDAYLAASCGKLRSCMETIIDQLNRLADNRYTGLFIPFEKCMAGIQQRLAERIRIPAVAHTLPLDRLGKDDIAAAGGKFALLGEIVNRLKLSVPAGFVITTGAYRHVMRHNRIDACVQNLLEDIDIRDYAVLRKAAEQLRKTLLEAEIPIDLQEEIYHAYDRLRETTGCPSQTVAVRSSAVQEDGRISFAGQYKSALNVRRNRIIEAYRSILASQFLPRALFYFKDKGFYIEEMAMAVGVLAMVNAEVSGVMYTRDAAAPEKRQILVNAVWGLGPYAVDGRVSSDYYSILDSESGVSQSRLEPGGQKVMLVCHPAGGVEESAVPPHKTNRPCLTNGQVTSLSRAAEKLEKHFGHPQDVEFAFDTSGSLRILQSRPLRIVGARGRISARPRILKDEKILLDGGKSVYRGVGAGRVRLVENEADFERFTAGEVLVVRHSQPEYAILLKKAAALISDIGTPLGHLAAVAREYRVPTVFNTDCATTYLRDGMEVTVDAVYAVVYEGKVEALLGREEDKDPLADTPMLRKLDDILRFIVPLNLTDPRSPNFSPQGCRTLHDITRFAHEAAVQGMFALSRKSRFRERGAKRLVSEAKLMWWVIDLGGGIAPESKRKQVHIDQIRSIPLRALWEGMTAVSWAGPPPIDTKGFLSVMTAAGADPSIEPAAGRRDLDKNYILAAKNFCNISTRLGFHFSTAEAFVGDEPVNNYISFVYTGGGADEGRKIRRARLIERLLKRFDFQVEIKKDAIFARIEGHKSAFVQSRLKVLGYLLVHTRQMDMVMFNDKMIDWYYGEHEKKNMRSCPGRDERTMSTRI